MTKKMNWRGVGAAISLITSFQVHAEPSKVAPTRDLEGWALRTDESDCTIAANFDNDSFLMIEYDQRLNNAVVTFTDPSVKSLKTGDKKSLQTTFLMHPDLVDDGWGKTEFNVFVTAEGVTAFSKKFDGADFLKDFARSRTLAFLFDEVILQSYNLQGSGVAVQALRQCARERAKVNPSDPFS